MSKKYLISKSQVFIVIFVSVLLAAFLILILDTKPTLEQQKEKRTDISKLQSSSNFQITETKQPTLPKRNVGSKTKKITFLVKNELDEPIVNAKLEELRYSKNTSALLTNQNGLVELEFELFSFFIGLRNLKISHKNYASKLLFDFDPQRFSGNMPIHIVLQKAYTIKGIVRNTEGLPLSGIRVCLKLNQYMANFPNSQIIDSVYSNDFGVFEFANVSANNYCFTGIGNGYYLTSSKTYIIPRSNEIELTLTTGFAYKLQVVNELDEAIPNVKIYYWCEDENQTETDSEGFVTLTFGNKDAISFSLEHPEYIAFKFSNSDWKSDFLPKKIVLHKGAVVYGTVIDQFDSSPVSDIRVYCVDNMHNTFVTNSDSLGHYKITCLPDSLFNIYAESPKYDVQIPSSIKVEKGRSLEKNLVLKRGKKIVLRFINSKNKKPIVNKSCIVQNQSQPFQTDENGEIVLFYRNSKRNSKITEDIYVEGFVCFTQSIDLNLDKIDCELLPEVKLKLFPIDLNGKLIDEVELMVTNFNLLSECITFDTASRCYEISGLSEGLVEITANKFNYVTKQIKINLRRNIDNSNQIIMEPFYHLIFNFTCKDSTLDLSQLNFSIIFDCEDYKEPDIVYNEREKCYETFLDLTGCNSFSIRVKNYLAIPEIRLKKETNGYTKYDFELLTGLEISGKVTDIDGNPIPNASIYFGSEPLHVLGPFYDKLALVQSDKYGNFKSTGNQAHKYFMVAIAPGFLSLHQSGYINGKGITYLKLVLEKGFAINGIIKDFTGKPCSNALIFLKNRGFKEKIENIFLNFPYKGKVNKELTTTSDREGRFQIDEIPKGEYLLTVISNSGSLYDFSLIVSEENNLNNLQIKLSESLKISGKAVDENDAPLTNFVVYFRSENETDYLLDRNAETDKEGNFIVTGATHQKYMVKFYSSDYTLDDNIRVLGGDENVLLKFKSIPKNETTIKGQVLMPNGELAAEYQLFWIDNRTLYCSQIKDIVKTPNDFQFNIKIEDELSYGLIATSPGFSAGAIDKISKSTDFTKPLVLTLKNNLRLGLKILDRNTRKPAENAKVMFSSNQVLSTIESKFKEPFYSDSCGYLNLENLNIGELSCIIDAAGYCAKGVVFTISEGENNQEILLGKGGAVSGVIIDSQNKPVPFVDVYFIRIFDFPTNHAEQLLDFQTISTLSNDKGLFKKAFIPPGKYYVGTDANSRLRINGVFMGYPIEVIEGQEVIISQDDIIKYSRSAKVKILLKGVSIEGVAVSFVSLLDKQVGFEPKFGVLELVSDDDFNWSTISQFISDQDGQITVPRVPFGAHTLYIFCEESTKSFSFKVSSEEDINLEILID